MLQKFKLVALTVVLGAAIVGCSSATKPTTQEPAKPTQPSLEAVKTEKAPVLDGVAEDVWNSAKEVKVDISGGGKLQGSGGEYVGGKTQVAIRALYDADNVYMQLKWADPTESTARGPWVMENGKLVKKEYNESYEDKIALNWNVNDSVAGFNEKGCAITCHTTEFKDAKDKAIIKHWTNGANELLDMWHWKLTRQNNLFGKDKPGLMHDQFMDNVTFDPNDEKKSGAGRHADPGDKDYTDNVTGKKGDWGQPKLVFDGEPVNGNKYVIVNGLDKVKPFTADYLKTMKEGDTIPGPIANQLSGDNADIKAKGKYENGFWILEIQRKLKTDGAKDVQFSDLSKDYFFAVAGFDNSQIGHAYMPGTIKFQFKK
jgi:hypothetical protein